MSYTKTVWNDDKAPFIEASNLNKMEEGIKSACDGVDELNKNIENYLPLGGGTVSGNVSAKRNDGNEVSFGVENSLAKGIICANRAGRFGLYDSLHNKWLIFSDENGNVFVEGSFTTENITSKVTLNDKLSSNYTKIARNGDVVTVTLRCDSELSASENLITGLPNPHTHLLGIPLINSSSGVVEGYMNVYTGANSAVLQNIVAKSSGSRVATFTYVTA